MKRAKIFYICLLTVLLLQDQAFAWDLAWCAKRFAAMGTFLWGSHSSRKEQLSPESVSTVSPSAQLNSLIQRTTSMRPPVLGTVL